MFCLDYNQDEKIYKKGSKRDKKLEGKLNKYQLLLKNNAGDS